MAIIKVCDCCNKGGWVKLKKIPEGLGGYELCVNCYDEFATAIGEIDRKQQLLECEKHNVMRDLIGRHQGSEYREVGFLQRIIGVFKQVRFVWK